MVTMVQFVVLVTPAVLLLLLPHLSVRHVVQVRLSRDRDKI